MGGPGSGSHLRRGIAKKRVVEICLTLSISRLLRDGGLREGHQSAGSLVWTFPSGAESSIAYVIDMIDPAAPLVALAYSAGGERRVYTIDLTFTAPRFGGRRWWFACPLAANGTPCARRVAKLYLASRSRLFGCRQCHQLTYTSRAARMACLASCERRGHAFTTRASSASLFGPTFKSVSSELPFADFATPGRGI